MFFRPRGSIVIDVDERTRTRKRRGKHKYSRSFLPETNSEFKTSDLEAHTVTENREGQVIFCKYCRTVYGSMRFDRGSNRSNFKFPEKKEAWVPMHSPITTVTVVSDRRLYTNTSRDLQRESNLERGWDHNILKWWLQALNNQVLQN